MPCTGECGRHYADLVLIETVATDHVGTDNPSFEDAMAKIFKQ